MSGIEFVPSVRKFVDDDIAKVGEIFQAFADDFVHTDVVCPGISKRHLSVETTRPRAHTPGLYPQVHYGFGRVRYRVAAELNIRAVMFGQPGRSWLGLGLGLG